MPIGKVKYFNRPRGFGFIEPEDGGESVWFHVTSLHVDMDDVLGSRVGYELAKNTAYAAKVDPNKSQMAVRIVHV